ncbi:MAG: hypothetical protein MRZ41_05525 [Eubacterium sp.]|nr:hypothetical protein [Eubacterium sp.]
MPTGEGKGDYGSVEAFWNDIDGCLQAIPHRMIYKAFYAGAFSIIPKGNFVGEIDVNPTFHYNENKRE